MKYFGPIAAFALLATPLAPASSRSATPQSVRTQDVLAEVTFLAGGALRGRGSASPDEAIAAAYVASQFQSFGLKPAPGMQGFLQTVPLNRQRLAGPPTLTVAGKNVPGVGLLVTAGGSISGSAAMLADPDAAIPDAVVVVYTGPADKLMTLARKTRGTKVKLLITVDSEMTRRFSSILGGAPQLPTTLEGAPPRGQGFSLATVPAAALATLTAGAEVKLDAPVATEKVTSTNAIAYLPGTDPKAGVILLSAHLDHLGVKPDGTVMPGANDDASGTVAVIELARYFSAGWKPKRGILFVAYGSEEIGGLGSRWFGEHPPVPLTDIVANIEFEMIGSQDPKLPKGALMMTGSERSNMFEMMKQNGALVAADPYPDQHFFERSDNYSLALKGIVAHTFSGWAVVPTYHQPTDTVENLDIPFMTRAISSLFGPIQKLASGDFKPEWKAGGRPQP